MGKKCAAFICSKSLVDYNIKRVKLISLATGENKIEGKEWGLCNYFGTILTYNGRIILVAFWSSIDFQWKFNIPVPARN